MQLIPSEFVIGGVYFPPLLIAALLGVVMAWLTAANAGLGFRSRVVRPKSQSSISLPPRYHSSVHANKKAPLQPEAKAVSICQVRLSA